MRKGYLRFAPIGYLYALACWGGQVRFADGTVGSIGLDGRKDPRHEVPELRDMYVDVGATGRDQVRQKVGDVAGFWPGFTSQGSAWFSPNLDDRAGCIVLVQLLRDLKDADDRARSVRGLHHPGRGGHAVALAPRPTPSSPTWPSRWM